MVGKHDLGDGLVSAKQISMSRLQIYRSRSEPQYIIKPNVKQSPHPACEGVSAVV